METNNNDVKVEVVETKKGGIKEFVKKHKTKIIVGVVTVLGLGTLGVIAANTKGDEEEVVALPDTNSAIDVNYTEETETVEEVKDSVTVEE